MVTALLYLPLFFNFFFNEPFAGAASILIIFLLARTVTYLIGLIIAEAFDTAARLPRQIFKVGHPIFHILLFKWHVSAPYPFSLAWPAAMLLLAGFWAGRAGLPGNV
jgi:hypothetical protein